MFLHGIIGYERSIFSYNFVSVSSGQHCEKTDGDQKCKDEGFGVKLIEKDSLNLGKILRTFISFDMRYLIDYFMCIMIIFRFI